RPRAVRFTGHERLAVPVPDVSMAGAVDDDGRIAGPVVLAEGAADRLPIAANETEHVQTAALNVDDGLHRAVVADGDARRAAGGQRVRLGDRALGDVAHAESI